MADSRHIGVESLGIGTVLKRYTLVVPPNQREYAWTEKEVGALLSDLQGSIDGNDPSYFLGTIALTGQNPTSPEVTDGQQRLATVTILLAAIRDYCKLLKDEWHASWIDLEFISVPDPTARRNVTRLTLNVDDSVFFTRMILPQPSDKPPNQSSTRSSHERISAAMKCCAEQVRNIANVYTKDADKINRLRQWVEYIRDNARVVALLLPDDQNAFRMFETLNDRGLKTSQVDILKNYLFKESRDKNGGTGDVQPKWSRMIGILEGIDGEDVEIAYVRHYVIAQYGMTRSSEVYKKIETKVRGGPQAAEFVADLEEAASDYAAITSPDHSKWSDGNQSAVRRSLRTMQLLKVVVTRPLMLAIARHFDPKETDRAFRLLVNWTVRFLIVGGGRSESVERATLRPRSILRTGRSQTQRHSPQR